MHVPTRVVAAATRGGVACDLLPPLVGEFMFFCDLSTPSWLCKGLQQQGGVVHDAA
jgi:hypothetical protein